MKLTKAEKERLDGLLKAEENKFKAYMRHNKNGFKGVCMVCGRKMTKVSGGKAYGTYTCRCFPEGLRISVG